MYYLASSFRSLVPFSMMGNLWLVKFIGLILRPTARTKHIFPVTENGAFKQKCNNYSNSHDTHLYIAMSSYCLVCIEIDMCTCQKLKRCVYVS